MTRSDRKETQHAFDRSDLVALKTKSAQVRYLTSLGYTRSEVSDMLNIRYQHVRNILMTKLKGE